MKVVTQKNDTENGEKVTIEPLVLNSVLVKTTTFNVRVPKEVPYDVDVPNYINKNFERPVPVDTPYERPVITEKLYEVPVVVEAEQTLQVATRAAAVLDGAEAMLTRTETMLNGVNESAMALDSLIDKMNLTMKEVKEKLDGVKNYEVVKEDLVVKVPKLVYETKHVIGKVVVKGA